MLKVPVGTRGSYHRQKENRCILSLPSEGLWEGKEALGASEMHSIFVSGPGRFDVTQTIFME